MAPGGGFFKRPAGKGWLILSGGPAVDPVLLRVCAILSEPGSIVVLVPGRSELEDGQARLETLSELCGLPGLVAALGGGAEQEAARAVEAIEEAALVALLDAPSLRARVADLRDGPVADALIGALDAGCAVLGEGAGAEVLGDVVETAAPQAGLGWLRRAVIQSGFVPGRPCPSLLARPRLYRLGLADGSALALGPAGEIQVWGDPAPTVTLGASWSP